MSRAERGVSGNRVGTVVGAIIAIVAVLGTTYLLTSREASLRCGARTLESGSAAFAASGWRVELTGVSGFRCVFLDGGGAAIGTAHVGWPVPGLD